jgi:hypothetical protein
MVIVDVIMRGGITKKGKREGKEGDLIVLSESINEIIIN